MQNAQTIASDPPKHSIGTWNGARKDVMKLIISAGTEMWPGAYGSGETVVMVVRLHPCRLTHNTHTMNATNLHRTVIEDCLACFNHFESEGISAYEDCGDVYVTIRGFDTVQISRAEVLLRADEFKSEING